MNHGAGRSMAGVRGLFHVLLRMKVVYSNLEQARFFFRYAFLLYGYYKYSFCIITLFYDYHPPLGERYLEHLLTLKLVPKPQAPARFMSPEAETPLAWPVGVPEEGAEIPHARARSVSGALEARSCGGNPRRFPSVV